jgi:hypothetical protein
MSDEIFNLDRAERLLPKVEQLLRIALEEKSRISTLGREQAKMIERIIVQGGTRVNPAQFSTCKQGKEEAAARLRQTAEEIESLGCLLKDLDIGLVDFPSKLGDRELYLCWKLGEPHIQFWHYVEEGFAGRKPLDEDMIRRLQGPSAQ